jgi:hypothetical protein
MSILSTELLIADQIEHFFLSKWSAEKALQNWYDENIFLRILYYSDHLDG